MTDHHPMDPHQDRAHYESIRRQADLLWARLRSGDATREDADMLRQWCAQSPDHARAWREVRDVWQLLKPAAANVARTAGLAGASAGDAGTAGGDHAGGKAGARGRPGRRGGQAGFGGLVLPGRRAWMGAATLAGGAWLLMKPPLQWWPSLADLAADYHTGTGEQRRLALEQGVVVQMNTQTRLNLRHSQGQVRAITLLAGEASIDVPVAAQRAVPAAARPDAQGDGAALPPARLVIQAGAGQVLADAALVNLRHTGDEVCVTCLSGQVRVMHDSRGSAVLSAAMQLRYAADRFEAAMPLANPDQAAAWRTGVLVFDGEPLVQVVAEINRYRPGRIILRSQELAQVRVQMRFSIHQTDMAVNMIRDLYGARITELPTGIVLLS